MDTRRLLFLAELLRLGSMRAVADELDVTTSTVSQQIAALARETGATLIEADGRRVRLTPAGRRLAEHAVTILAALDEARLDLDPTAEPTGCVRVAGFATAVRRSLLPTVAELAVSHPKVRLLIHEHEPDETSALLAADAIDLGLIYDYNLAPAAFDRTLEATPLWSAAWELGIPTPPHPSSAGDTLAVFGQFREHGWIVNSRGAADEHVVRTAASMAGFQPDITHRADSLDLVHDLILAGLGVALLPADDVVPPGITRLPLTDPKVMLRAYAVTRRGRANWAPLALVLRLLTTRAGHIRRTGPTG